MSSFAAVRKQRTKHLAQSKGDAGIAGRKLALSLAKQTLHYIGGRMLAARPLCFCLQISSSTRETTINYFLLRAERDSAPRLSAICYIYVQAINGGLTIGLTFEQHSCAHTGQFAASSRSQRGGRLPQPQIFASKLQTLRLGVRQKAPAGGNSTGTRGYEGA